MVKLLPSTQKCSMQLRRVGREEGWWRQLAGRKGAPKHDSRRTGANSGSTRQARAPRSAKASPDRPTLPHDKPGGSPGGASGGLWQPLSLYTAPPNRYKLLPEHRRARVRWCAFIQRLAALYSKPSMGTAGFSSRVAFSNYHELTSPCGRFTVRFDCAICAFGFSQLLFLKDEVEVGGVKWTRKKHAAPKGLTAETFDVDILRELLSQMEDKFSSKLRAPRRRGNKVRWWWQQDRCSVHSTAATEARIAASLPGVRLLPWEARSPDLNPVESAVGDLEQKVGDAVSAGTVTYEDALEWKDQLIAAWATMSGDAQYRSGLFSRWEARVETCLVHGGYKLKN